MNDADLNAILQRVPLAERPEEYWDDFPRQVQQRLDRLPLRRAEVESWLPRLAWVSSLAFAALVISLGVWSWQTSPGKATRQHFWAKSGKPFQTQVTQFTCRLNRLMRDEHGLHYLIAESEQN